MSLRSATTKRALVTATINIQVGRRDGVLRVPGAALRWVPTREMFSATHQAVPPQVAAEMSAKNRAYEGATGYVWVLNGAELHALPVKIGLSDGAFTEVSGAGVTEGLPVVTGETLVR